MDIFIREEFFRITDLSYLPMPFFVVSSLLPPYRQKFRFLTIYMISDNKYNRYEILDKQYLIVLLVTLLSNTNKGFLLLLLHKTICQQ